MTVGLMAKKRDPDGRWVVIQDVWPLFERLIEVYGTKAKVAKAMGVHKQGFLNPNKKYMQQRLYMQARNLLASHEEHLHSKVNGAVILEVVDGKQFSAILREWITWYIAEHPQGYGPFAGPVQVLAEWSGMTVRNVSRHTNGEIQFVSYDNADKLLTAIDKQHLLSNGTLKVMANPTLSMEGWLSYMEKRGCL